MGARTLNELKLRHETRSQRVKVLKVFKVIVDTHYCIRQD